MLKRFSSEDLKKALGAFSTGVAVVTTRSPEGLPIGLTVNSFNSVSLDPPLVLFSLARKAFSLPSFIHHRHFAVHVLQKKQKHLSQHFAAPGGDKWATISYGETDSGCPLLPGCASVFDCRLDQEMIGGDHLVLIGRVQALYSSDEVDPLVYHQGRYGDFEAH
jgi:flavin reductase (DIM6/NTAB) family NADH-FMN oxidoreductase RutF|tara:strand:- start:16818 stop:17306 length:489 start_codon:yes stop_codon:yes gene_type:complete